MKALTARRERALLVVGADDESRHALRNHFLGATVSMTFASTPAKAVAALESAAFDGIVIDMAGPAVAEAIDAIEADPAGCADLPVMILERPPLSADVASRLDRLSGTLLLHRFASINYLLDGAGMLLHCTGYGLRAGPGKALDHDPVLAGRKVLIIDDDFRNIFALTSALEQHRMEVFYAETGRDGIEMLKSRPDIDVALVDVMMPELDGYDTMREIRKTDRLAMLPLIAVTAKAMKGDREKCLAAGASDYLAKPVDVDRLLSMMRVWLRQTSSAPHPA
jgi:CheY-like chemotaxis protein